MQLKNISMPARLNLNHPNPYFAECAADLFHQGWYNNAWCNCARPLACRHRPPPMLCAIHLPPIFWAMAATCALFRNFWATLHFQAPRFIRRLTQSICWQSFKRLIQELDLYGLKLHRLKTYVGRFSGFYITGPAQHQYVIFFENAWGKTVWETIILCISGKIRPVPLCWFWLL